MTPTGTDEITEIIEFQAEAVSGVATPANGASWLVLKAAAAEDDDEPSTQEKFKANAKRMKEGKQPVSKPTEAEKSDSPEADEIEEKLTKGAYCGDQDCEVCIIKDEEGVRFSPAVKDISQADRKKMPASSFAFVDKNGGKHLPIHDEGHVRSAMGRIAQQDFSEAKGDPGDAKKKAASKIVSAAKKHGIEVDDKSAVAQAAKSAQQDALGGIGEPKAAGHLDGSKSGLAGPVATGTAKHPPNAAQTEAGASSYDITIEPKVIDNKPAPDTLDGAGIIPSIAKTVQEFAALVAARASAPLAKEGKILTLTPPQGDAALSPGSPAWESHDAATLQQVGDCLASCCNALDQIAARERTEGATVDPADAMNAWDLEEAEQALEYALGVVARLSFHEAAEGQATKAGRVLSGKNHDALTAARDHLQAVIDGAQGKAASADDSDKESDKIMTTLTKDELAESIAAGSAAAVKAALDEERKAKKAKKKAKAEKEAAEKENAIDAGAPQGEHPTATADANDVNAIPNGGDVDPKYIRKSIEDLTKGLGDLQEQLAQVNELTQRIAQRPRPGGPRLDGQAPQGAGDLQPAAKEQDGEIARLEKAVADAREVGSPEQLQWAGEALTKARLRRLNEAMGWPTGS